MPIMNPLGNKLPFFGPYNRESTENVKSIPQRLWDWANTGLISGDTIIGATSGATREEVERAMQDIDPDHPYKQAARTFALGAYKDLADLASSFTSPLSLALGGVGGLAVRGNAARKALQSGLRLNRGRQLALQAAPAANTVLAGAGAGFSARGAHDLATGKPLETLASAANILTGEQSTVSPQEARKPLLGGAALFGGAAGAVSPFRFSRVPLRDLPDQVLPQNTWISASNHDNSPITFEQAGLLRDGTPFRDFVRYGENAHPRYLVPQRSTTTSVSLYQRQAEPAVTFGTRKRPGVNALASDIGRKYGQNEVLVFRAIKSGSDVQHTLSGLKNPRAAMDLLREKYGVDAGRIEGNKIVIVDRNGKLRNVMKAAVEELGASYRTTPGDATFIKKADFDRQIRQYNNSNPQRRKK
jgi:hypothetical protein